METRNIENIFLKFLHLKDQELVEEGGKVLQEWVVYLQSLGSIEKKSTADEKNIANHILINASLEQLQILEAKLDILSDRYADLRLGKSETERAALGQLQILLEDKIFIKQKIHRMVERIYTQDGMIPLINEGKIPVKDAETYLKNLHLNLRDVVEESFEDYVLTKFSQKLTPDELLLARSNFAEFYQELFKEYNRRYQVWEEKVSMIAAKLLQSPFKEGFDPINHGSELKEKEFRKIFNKRLEFQLQNQVLSQEQLAFYEKYQKQIYDEMMRQYQENLQVWHQQLNQDAKQEGYAKRFLDNYMGIKKIIYESKDLQEKISAEKALSELIASYLKMHPELYTINQSLQHSIDRILQDMGARYPSLVQTIVDTSQDEKYMDPTLSKLGVLDVTPKFEKMLKRQEGTPFAGFFSRREQDEKWIIATGKGLSEISSGLFANLDISEIELEKEKRPSLIKAQQLFDDLSARMVLEMLAQPCRNKKEFVARVDRYFQLMEHCYQKGDIWSAQLIFSAVGRLEISVIYKKCLTEVDFAKKYTEKYDSFSERFKKPTVDTPILLGRQGVLSLWEAYQGLKSGSAKTSMAGELKASFKQFHAKLKSSPCVCIKHSSLKSASQMITEKTQTMQKNLKVQKKAKSVAQNDDLKSSVLRKQAKK